MGRRRGFFEPSDYQRRKAKKQVSGCLSLIVLAPVMVIAWVCFAASNGPHGPRVPQPPPQPASLNAVTEHQETVPQPTAGRHNPATWLSPYDPTHPQPRTRTHARRERRARPAPVRSYGRNCVRGCPCGNSCIPCSHRCRH